MTSLPSSGRKRDGSLRTALVDAGIELLRERGPDGLSLRECAAKAGVSHAAPAYHFKNMMGLSTAIAGRGFRLFSDAMSARLTAAGPAPFDSVAAICHGYLDFASGHPELFLFIFSGQAYTGEDEDFRVHSERAYAILKEACAPFVPAGSPSENVEALVWSLVHGYAHLTISGKMRERKHGRPWPEFEPLLAHLDTALTAGDQPSGPEPRITADKAQ